MGKALTNSKILYIMADFETSCRPDDNNSVYAWLTGFKVCGLMDDQTKEWLDYSFLNIKDKIYHFHGKQALKQWLDSIFVIVDICQQNDIKVVVFFHNARYDYSYIQYYILNDCNGYKNKSGKYYINMSDQLIDENNVFYGSRISYKIRSRKGNGEKIKDKTLSFSIMDLFKILPSSLAAIGDSLHFPKGKDFDYERIIPYDYGLTKSDMNYFQRDIEIMCKAYKNVPSFFYGKMTIGSIVKNYYLTEFVPKLKANPKTLFPISDSCLVFRYDGELEFDKEKRVISTLKAYENIMPGYKGGMTLANKEYLGKCLYNGKLPKHLRPKKDKLKVNGDIFHDDVNSLYPSVMQDNSYPVGRPKIIYKSKQRDNTKELEKYLIKEMNENNKKIIIEVIIKKGHVKKGKAPYFLKSNLNKEDNEINEKNSYKSFYESFEYDTEVLTLEEFLKIKENYNMIYTIEKAYIFMSAKGLFTEFINKLSAMKIEYDDDPFLRTCYKLLMNNLYGKFGEKPEKKKLYKDLDSEGNWLKGVNSDKNDHTTNTIITDYGIPFYPPIAIYVTSYARIKMMNYINIVGWNNILYMDTDSLHIIGEENQKKLEYNNLIHNTKLGLLKLEDICFGERVLSPKKYCYYGIVTKNGKVKFSVKCAGLPAKAQEGINSFDQFYYGLTFIPESLLNDDKTMYRKKVDEKWEVLPNNCLPIGKLVQRHVKGGIYLKPCIFSIQVPEYIKFKNKINLDQFNIETIML